MPATRIVVQGFAESGNLVPVQPRQIGMQPRRLHSRRRELGRQCGLALPQIIKFGLKVIAFEAIADRLDQPVQLSGDQCQLAFLGRSRGVDICIRFVHFVDEGFHEDLNQIGFHQMVPESIEHDRLDDLATDRTGIVAGTFAPGRRTSKVVFANRRHRSSAAAALDQTRQEMLRAAMLPEPCLFDGLRARAVGNDGKPGLNPLPDRLLHNPEVGDHRRDDLGGLVRPRHALARVRVFHKVHPIPGQFADIEPVPENAGSPGRVATERRVRPFTTLGAGNTLGIEQSCDGAGRVCFGKQRKYPLDDRRLFRVDLAVAAYRFATRVMAHDSIVSITQPAAALAGEYAAFKPAMCLERQIGDVERIHRPLQPDR